MSDTPQFPRDVHVAAWVESAKSDPVKFRDRQVTEILLTAIGMTPELKGNLILKGGLLMTLAYGSVRSTSDVDFTTMLPSKGFNQDGLKKSLNDGMARAAAALGHVDLVCQVQKIKTLPHKPPFEEANFPALKITVASATRGTHAEKRMIQGMGLQVVALDISFNEPIHDTTELRLDDSSITVQAYALSELIAEKLRSLLQQVVRERNRRQDVYDIAYLVEQLGESIDLDAVLQSFLEKCRSREIEPTPDSISNPEVIRRAREDWDTMQLELQEPLPAFDDRFAVVETFYRSMPWS